MKYFLFLLCLVPTVAFSQKDELTKFLTALSAPELQSSKEIIKQTSYPGAADYTLGAFKIGAGEKMNTDNPAVNGYSCIVTAEALNKAGTMTEKRFIAVLYKTKEGKWKVFGFRTAADPCYEYEASQKNVDAGKFYTDKKFVYRNLAYWALMCGKIEAAKQAISNAKKEAEGDSEFQLTPNDVLNDIL